MNPLRSRTRSDTKLGKSLAVFSTLVIVLLAVSYPAPSAAQAQSGVILSSSVLSFVGSPGGTYTIPIAVSNVGQDLETINLAIIAPDNWTARLLVQGLEVTETSIQSGKSLPLDLEITIPPTASFNTDYVAVIATGTSRASLPISIRVEQSNNDIVTCKFSGKTIIPGESTQFQVTVSNPLSVQQQFNLLVTSPSGWTVSVEDTGGETISQVTLGGSESVNLVIYASAPITADEGRYNLTFTAESQNMSQDLQLLVLLHRASARIEASAVPPYLDVYAGSKAKFTLKISNVGGYDELLNLTTQGLPEDLSATFQDSLSQEITKLYLEPAKSSNVYLIVTTPAGATLGAQNITIPIVGQGVNSTISLTLNVIGLYQVKVTTTNFYTSLNVGGTGSFTLNLANDGSEVLHNLKVVQTGTTPDGFTLDITPSSGSNLNTGNDTDITFTITTQSDVSAGTYYLNFNVLSDQTQAQSFALQVEVQQNTSWVIYAIVLIIAAIVGMFLIYRKFGRR
jgi:uncharacterized membrane protein